MYAGKPVELGTVDDVYYEARMPYTVGLLGSLPRLDLSDRARLTPIAGSPPSLINLPPGCPFGPRCPLHRELCDEQEPELLAVGALDHLAACHFSDELTPDTVAASLFDAGATSDAVPTPVEPDRPAEPDRVAEPAAVAVPPAADGVTA